MIALELHVNGEKKYVAGLDERWDSRVLKGHVVLAISVDEVIPKSRISHAQIVGTVGDLSHDSAEVIREQFFWPEYSLSVGDEVTFKVVDRDDCDPPGRRRIFGEGSSGGEGEAGVPA